MKSIGMIGFGKMGILHSAILNTLQNTQVKAICERDRLLNRLARGLLPKTITFYRDHLKMIEKENLDAVFITTPIGTHAQLIVDLVDANNDLSVFVEKPLVSSYEETKVTRKAAKNLRGIHMVGFQKRFSPIFQRAKACLDNEAIGEVMFFRAYSFSSDMLRESHSWRVRRGTGGVILDLAPHLLDLLLWFFGNPVKIAGIRRRIYSAEVDDYVHAAMAFDSGLTGHADVSWSMRGFRLPEILIEVHGKKGMLSVTDDCLRVQKENGGSYDGGNEIYYKHSFNNSVSFLLAEPEYTLEDQAFLEAIENRILPTSNFFEAAKVNELIDRILKNTEI